MDIFFRGGGGALTGGVVCVERESAFTGSLRVVGYGRSRRSVANRVAKKAVSAATTSTGVSIFRAGSCFARLLESGRRFFDMGKWMAHLPRTWQATVPPRRQWAPALRAALWWPV